MIREEHTKTNREKRLSPKSNSLHWCFTCDRSLVSNGKKCKVCGKADFPKRLKKDT